MEDLGDQLVSVAADLIFKHFKDSGFYDWVVDRCMVNILVSASLQIKPHREADS